MTPLLSARAVSRRFGAHVALQRTELDVREGEVLALVGPNGAGKSTLLALFAGALEPSEGRVETRPGIKVSAAVFPILERAKEEKSGGSKKEGGGSSEGSGGSKSAGSKGSSGKSSSGKGSD